MGICACQDLRVATPHQLIHSAVCVMAEAVSGATRLTCIDINAGGGHCGQSTGKGDLKGSLADDAGSLHGKDSHCIPAGHTTAFVTDNTDHTNK